MSDRFMGSHDVMSLLHNAYSSRGHNLKQSIVVAGRALALSRKRDDKQLIGKSLNLLSLFYMIRGEYKRSLRMAKDAIKYFEQLDDERGIADAKYNIAGVYYKTDNYHLGLVNLMDSLRVYRKYNDYHNEARAQKSLGTIYEYFGDRKNAIRSYTGAIDAAKKVKDIDLIANAYNPLSGIYLKMDKVQLAMKIAGKSISIKTKSGDVRGLAFALYARAKVHAAQQNWSAAEIDFRKALDIHYQMGERLGLAMVYCKLGSLYTKTGQFERAKKLLDRALRFSTKYNIIYTSFKSSYQLYRIYKQEGDTQRSLEYLEQYLHQKETVINAQTQKVIENYELINRIESTEKQAQMDKERERIIQNQQRAEEAASIKQNFLSTMSHEIRTPLNAVITISSLLAERVDDEDKQLLDSLKFAANNLLLIINDILDFTKLDTGKMQLEQRPSNLLKLLKNLSNTYDNMARSKGIETSLHVDNRIAEVYEFDEAKVSQIINNLISNAIKFTDEGKVSVDVKLINSTGEFDTIKFKVTDTGIGIPSEFFDEMFNSFTQPKSVTTRKQGGSGLGLAIVKKLIELHQSNIHFTSVVGKGSCFYFELRLKKAGIKKAGKGKPLNRLQNKVALLADDNMINAMVARKLLSNWGVTAEHAINGVDAIEKAANKTFDFILMDIHMPEMNGFDATIHIRNNHNPNTHTPIFALTADVTAEHHEEYNTYFNGFLRKPIEIEKLYEALAGVS
ncbi:ATP-binding protein [uncultured Mucilaginibacter sp.]|uniref:ATP-binding protein n=1 Tax=uncultured Mucilaginibacter sp. TaxID=797541 RepID=UPI0025DF0186|nr:ATP-binding protein [uncultured Mucilaginibacter sp.]